jgi:dipicolinate synthase subunit B
MEEKLRVGLAMCGSFCTFDKVLTIAEGLADRYDLTGILSERAANTDTRFGAAADHIVRLEALTGKPVMTTITEAEHIGPKKLFDVLVIAPCTGNTLAKLAHGVTDTAVTMAAKAHLRNGRPLCIAFTTNDGLSVTLQNVGAMLTRKNVYFVPFHQDDPMSKPNSLAADFTKLEQTFLAAIAHTQLQPILSQ